MSAAGYSGTPLPKKLGITGESEVLVLGETLGFELTGLGVALDRAPKGSYDVVLLFCPDVATLEANFDAARAAHTTAGSVWVCWPKKTSKIPTDLTEAAVRDHGLRHGQVDVKVAAVDAVWSGLKFVTRRSDR
jgi:hypothetical protein